MFKLISPCSFVAALFIAFSTVTFSACEEDDSIELDDGTVVKSTEPGDDFPDVPESYVLSIATQSSSVLPYDYENHLFTYHIRNASDLKLFCEQINNGEIEKFKEDFNEAFKVGWCSWQVTLEHNITIDKSFSWNAIGSGTHPMNMDFDGKGHTISGSINSKGTLANTFYLEDGSPMGCMLHGLFGSCQGAVSNLNVEADLRINITGSPVVAAGLLCGESNVNVKNVKVSGDMLIIVLGDVQGSLNCTEIYLGQIAGIHQYGDIEDCYSEGTMKFKKQQPPYDKYSIQAKKAYIGGLVGKTNESKITNCRSAVEIDITDARIEQSLRVGGVVGYTSSSTLGFGGEVKMLDVENLGNISIDEPKKINNVKDANVAIGGLIGYGRFNNENSGKITNSGSVYLGSTSLTGLVGGIVGYYDGMSAVTRVVNNADIKNHSQKSFTGGCYGIVADVAPTIKYADNYGNVSATEVVSHTEDYDEHSHMVYGLVGGVVGKATILVSGLLGSSHQSGGIHQCSNAGDVTSGENFYYNGIECSPAGCISGDGFSVSYCNTGRGKINGENAYILGYNGTTWRSFEKIGSGELSEEHDYWFYWKDFRIYLYSFDCSCDD